jgi:hypothetical protein
MPAELTPITGTDGSLVLLNGTPTALTAQATTNILNIPGGTLAYPALQLYQVSARTHKVWDPRVTPVVYNSATALPSTQYFIDWGNGLIVFYTPLTGTPVITVDFTYFPTASATDVVPMPHTSNLNLTMTGNNIPLDEYNTLIIPEARGKMQGTFQFDCWASSTSVDLLGLMKLRNYFVFAAYESKQTNRINILYSDLTGIPKNIPVNGGVGGTITATLKQLPSFVNEAL